MPNEQVPLDRSMVVLVIESDAVKRMATACDLRREGFEVFEAADTPEALIVLKTIDSPLLWVKQSEQSAKTSLLRWGWAVLRLWRPLRRRTGRPTAPPKAE